MHPSNISKITDWKRWRLTYEGGVRFRDMYLKKLNTKEDTADFNDRKAITPIPAYAKEGVVEVKNAIFQRAIDILRIGGADSYQAAILGYQGGVDNCGSTMNSFIMNDVLDELLPMAKVGIYIDMPETVGETLFEKGDQHPCLSIFKTESIVNWAYKCGELVALELKYAEYVYDENGLPTGTEDQTLMFRKTEEGVTCNNEKIAIGVIPFVMIDIPHSLLQDVDYYQIALLNLESCDINSAIKSNFSFYTEQFDPATEMVNNFADKPIEVGSAQGRRYSKGMDKPAFINPSSEPLTASMAKQTQMKETMRTLMHLNLSNMSSSADSKDRDTEGLEGGLAAVGLILERAERAIARIWDIYEGTSYASSSSASASGCTIQYPTRYNLRTFSDRLKEAGDQLALGSQINSLEGQKVISLATFTSLYGSRVNNDTLNSVAKEITNSEIPIITKDIDSQIERGLVSSEYASQEIYHYPKGQVEIAQKEHAERLARIQAAQTSVADTSNQDPLVQGIPDADPDPEESGKNLKAVNQNVDISENSKQKTRGEAK